MCRCGGLILGISSLHCRKSSIVVDSCCLICSISRYRHIGLHFAIGFIRSIPPVHFGLCSVERGTLNIFPSHIKYMIVVLILFITSYGGERNCATYHIFANKYMYTYCIRCCKVRCRWYTSRVCCKVRAKVVHVFLVVSCIVL